MHALKSKFISIYLMTTFLFLVISIQKYFEWGRDIHWIFGAALHAIPLAFIGYLFLGRPARTSRSLPYLSVAVLILFSIIAFGIDYSERPLKQPIIYSTFSALGWFVYLYWYSFLPGITHGQLRSGKGLPNLIFTDLSGKEVKTSEFKGKTTLYMFYRGNWCPLCMAQIKEIVAQYLELEKRGVQVVLISAQPQRYTMKLASKYGLSMTFLCDPNHATKQVGLYQESGTPLGMELFGFSSDTTLPSVIITNTEGKIIYIDQTDNYRVRPEPETFLKIIDEIDA
ncbi:MAG: peroxiredoxin family protein [Cyclobacteriaceae bacterium]